MRACRLGVLGLFVIASPAWAGPILVLKEAATVSAAAQVTTIDGVTHVVSDEASGGILVHPTRSGIAANARDQCSGSGAAINESRGLIEFTVSIGGHTDCAADEGILDFGSSASAVLDMTFRPEADHFLDFSFYPTGGIVDVFLVDLTSRALAYQRQRAQYGVQESYAFANNHVYRLVARGMDPLSQGDPYADFSLMFRDSNGEGLGFAPAPVPEPMTMTLMGTGIAGLAVRRWRQRRRYPDDQL